MSQRLGHIAFRDETQLGKHRAQVFAATVAEPHASAQPAAVQLPLLDEIVPQPCLDVFAVDDLGQAVHRRLGVNNRITIGSLG